MITEQDIVAAATAGEDPYVALRNVADDDDTENLWAIDYIGVPDIPANRCSYVWVFKGNPKGTVSAVFSSRRRAHDWIKQHSLSG